MLRHVGFTSGLACAVVAAMTFFAQPASAAEINIGRQLGIGYLQVYVMEQHKLLKKHAKAEGIGDLTVNYHAIGSPAVLNDGLLSGKLDIVVAGPTSFLVLWDRTRGTDNAVKMISGLSQQPVYLVANTPRIKTLADFTADDRIAVPAVKTSTQAILLGIAAEKMFGKDQRTRFDKMQIAYSHPDAVVAMSTHSGITAHFASIPFYGQELALPGMHKVIDSYQILGGPATLFCLWTTTRFHDQHPKIIKALWGALEEATKYVKDHPDDATKIYLKLDNSKQSVESIVKLLADPQVVYSLTPKNLMPFADYMASSGMLRTKPQSWKDLVFPEAFSLPGS
ncbi:MAG TPA: ABC transporter substrate-binding protein [Casimicrobiaceae bacterium]|nr:ABC transporter substrate-binding protein [Casimicrobiaceae bacterium]